MYRARLNVPAAPGRRVGLRQIKERRRKTVALPPELAAVLKVHREAQDLEREAAANPWENHDVVFARENDRPIDRRADWQEWSHILSEAGIPQ